MPPGGPARRGGMGWRAVSGVWASGRRGLLWPRLMTGMWGGRGAGGARGERAAVVFGDAVDAVVGSRGGGEDRNGGRRGV